MAKWHLTNAEWKALAPILDRAITPKDQRRRGRGRPRSTDVRALAEACLFRFFHSLAPAYRAFGWNELPKALGVSPATANRRFREWTDSGAWYRFWDGLQRLRLGSGRFLTVESPVLPAITELHRAYAFFNRQLFENLLPSKVIITIEQMQRPRGIRGFFSPLNRYGHIALAFRSIKRGATGILHTLIHEMVHYRNHVVGIPDCHGRYHNRHFRDAAALAGLRCRWVPNHGYGVTSQGPRARFAIESLKPNKEVFRWTMLRSQRSSVRRNHVQPAPWILDSTAAVGSSTFRGRGRTA